eukprot:scpid60932/ scgid32689/ Nuclear factor NF-kappa-B p100 subunit; DNA-binding factor KBF2; Nuclear factor of kappa light polypeptide gene enhancer in B-cells 2; Nuclear factor NF-kappa-B p52 subunit
MDPKTKHNFRPEVDRLDKKMSAMAVDDKESYDSCISTMSSIDQDSNSYCLSGASYQSSFPGEQTRLRHKGEISETNESLGYGSMVASLEEPQSATAQAPETPAPATVEQPREEPSITLPVNNLFSSVLRQALSDPSALKPHDLGDPISEQDGADAAPQEDEQRSVSTEPYQDNTHVHNYACSGENEYLLAPFRAVLAEQNEDGDSSLHLGIIHGQIPVVEQIAAVWHGVPEYLNVQNNLGQTGMHLAIVTGQPRIVERLLWAGADPCRRDRHGDTCLHLAAKYADKTSANLILSVCQRHNIRRATLEARNYHGFTATHICVQRNHRDMLGFLVATWGADVDAEDYTAGRSPLHLAVEEEHISIASTLLFTLKANVDAQMYGGQTPLHIAAGRANQGMVALLVAAGARTDIVDGEGEQPADLTYNTQILRLCNA